MAFNRVTDADKDDKGVTGLPDTPNMTTADLQARFDSLGNLGLDKLNQLMDELEDTTAAGNIGIKCPSTVAAGNTLQAVINALANYTDKNTTNSHTHSNKDVLDGISADSKTGWDKTSQKFSDIESVQNVITDAENAIPSSHAVYSLVHDASFDDINKAIQGAKAEIEGFDSLAKSWAVGGTGTRDGEDYNNALYWANYAHTAEDHVAEAEKHVEAAVEKADLAESWAVGGTGKRDGEDTNNAKYWCEQAQGTVTGVSAFNGRSGAVTPASGDYSYDMITGTPTTATTTTDGLMSSADKTKLDGLSKVTVDTEVKTSSNPVANSAVKSVTDALQTAIDTLNGSGAGSVAKAVSDAIAKVVADAPSSFDTLKEISDWIASHSEDAATMNSAITKNTDAITAETSARSSADSALDSRVTTAESTIKANTTAITTETTNRTTAVSNEETARKSADSALETKISALLTPVRLGIKTLTAGETSLSWTNDAITDTCVIDVYCSVNSVAPTAQEQSGTTYTVTFDAQSADMQVDVVVLP